MALLPPYTPTTAVPDPEEVVFSEPHQVQVGRYHALAGTTDANDAARGTSEGMVVGKLGGPGEVLGKETMLYIEIRLASGKVQDLVVGSSGLSQRQLVLLVTDGLSTVRASASTASS